MTRTVDLDACRRALHNYDHLERFGGRYRTVLRGIYRVSREAVVSILNDHGDIRDDRTDQELFTAAAKYHPGHAGALSALFQLHGFAARDVEEPFNPSGDDPMLTGYVGTLRNLAIGLLDLATRVRANR